MVGAVSRAVTVWRAAQAEDKARPKVDRRGPELEFLPAAVEVLKRLHDESDPAALAEEAGVPVEAIREMCDELIRVGAVTAS